FPEPWSSTTQASPCFSSRECCRETERSGITSTLSEPRPMVVSASVSGYSVPLRGPAVITSRGRSAVFGRPLLLSYTRVVSPCRGGSEPGSVVSTGGSAFTTGFRGGGLAAGGIGDRYYSEAAAV